MRGKVTLMKCSKYVVITCLIIWISMEDGSESRTRRSAVALVRPRLMYDVSPKTTTFTDFEIKRGRGKQKCKIMPLKARNNIKADTIFTGTVESFHNRNNKWTKHFVDLKLGKVYA